MLDAWDVTGLAPATDLPRAREFHASVLGLRLIDENKDACVFDADDASHHRNS